MKIFTLSFAPEIVILAGRRMDVEDALNDGIVMLNDSISIPTSKSEYS
jgi:hypothetical protein